MVIAPQSDLTRPFAEGLTPAVMRDGQGKSRLGYLDSQRRTVIEPGYLHADSFVDGLAIVGSEDAWGAARFGAIDRKGHWVLKPVHEKLLPHSGGVLRSEGKGRVIRAYGRDGRDITPAGIDFVGIESEGLVRIWAGRQQGFMNARGDVVIPPRFSLASEFRDGMSRIHEGGKYGFVDRVGKIAVPTRFDAAEDFSEDLALVKEGESSLFVDKQGKPCFGLRPIEPIRSRKGWQWCAGPVVMATSTEPVGQ